MAIRVFELSICRPSNTGNPAICRHAITNDAVSAAQAAAQIIAFYANLVGIGDDAAPQMITQIKLSSPGSGAELLSFPATEYDAIRTANFTRLSHLPAMAGFNVSYGLGGLAPGGLAMVMREKTALNARHWGRSFLPWPGTGAMDHSTGTPKATAVTNVVQSYEGAFLAMGTTLAHLHPVVATPIGGGVIGLQGEDITGVSVSPNWGRLRSRLA